MTLLVAIRYGVSALAAMLFAAFVSANFRTLASKKGWDNFFVRGWDWAAEYGQRYLPRLAGFLAMVWSGRWWFWLVLGFSSGLAIALWFITPASVENPVAAFFSNPSIEWDGGSGDITFHSMALRPSEKMPVYLELGFLPNTSILPQTVLNMPFAPMIPHIRLSPIDPFEKGDQIVFTIGTVTGEANGGMILHLGNTQTSFKDSNFAARLVFVHPDHQEETYRFMAISRSTPGKPNSSIVIGPVFLDSFSKQD